MGSLTLHPRTSQTRLQCIADSFEKFNHNFSPFNFSSIIKGVSHGWA